ncbi:MAG: hypothetical protein MHMPM18_001974, partial [Marteilia pararefringens]
MPHSIARPLNCPFYPRCFNCPIQSPDLSISPFYRRPLNRPILSLRRQLLQLSTP